MRLPGISWKLIICFINYYNNKRKQRHFLVTTPMVLGGFTKLSLDRKPRRLSIAIGLMATINFTSGTTERNAEKNAEKNKTIIFPV